jgi:hypothetical protein
MPGSGRRIHAHNPHIEPSSLLEQLRDVSGEVVGNKPNLVTVVDVQLDGVRIDEVSRVSRAAQRFA